jgi:hypothetical protein
MGDEEKKKEKKKKKKKSKKEEDHTANLISTLTCAQLKEIRRPRLEEERVEV